MVECNWKLHRKMGYEKCMRRMEKGRNLICTHIHTYICSRRVQLLFLPRANEKRNKRLSVTSMCKSTEKEEEDVVECTKWKPAKHIGNYIKQQQRRKNYKPEPSASCPNLCRLQYSKWNFHNERKIQNPCYKNICACSSRELLLLLVLLQLLFCQCPLYCFI